LNRPLVIGIGNPLRGDDGAGWRLAEACSARMPDADVVTCHQLTPELALRIHDASFVLFFDASATGVPGEITSRIVRAGGAGLPLTHHLDADELLALTAIVYGSAPAALLLTVAGGSFGFGEALSPAVEAALPHAVGEAILHLASAGTDGRVLPQPAGTP
jgi:hydrogenase maturation protease